MHRRAQRAAVRTARLVMAEVRLGGGAWKGVGQKRDERHDVRLLHDLRALLALAADDDVDRHGVIGVGGDVQRFEPVEARELLVEAARRIEPRYNAPGRVAPIRELIRAEPEPFLERAGMLVKALSSTSSWYSSGPTTWRIWRRPSDSGTAREAQNRAVSSTISAPARTKKSSSPVARQYCQTA